MIKEWRRKNSKAAASLFIFSPDSSLFVQVSCVNYNYNATNTLPCILLNFHHVANVRYMLVFIITCELSINFETHTLAH